MRAGSRPPPGTTYSYNGLGERVKKASSASTSYFAYDEAGHLLGEYDAAGDLIQETVWFGDIPVAVLKPNGGSGISVFYIHTDHLNTPRRITRPSDNAILWRWDSDPFGATAADDDPDDDTITFAYHLRFPGPVLRRRDWAALQLLPRLRRCYRQIHSERSDRARWRDQYLCLR